MRATRASEGLYINSQPVTHAQFMHLGEGSKPEGTSITCGNEIARARKQTHRAFMSDGNQTLIHFLGHIGGVPAFRCLLLCGDDELNDLVYTSQDLECGIRITRELLICAMMTLFLVNASFRELLTATSVLFSLLTTFSLRFNTLDASKAALDDNVDQVLASSLSHGRNIGPRDRTRDRPTFQQIMGAFGPNRRCPANDGSGVSDSRVQYFRAFHRSCYLSVPCQALTPSSIQIRRTNFLLGQEFRRLRWSVIERHVGVEFFHVLNPFIPFIRTSNCNDLNPEVILLRELNHETVDITINPTTSAVLVANPTSPYEAARGKEPSAHALRTTTGE